MRIAIIDTVYPEVLPHMPLTGDYATSLRSALDFAFGTADFYSRNLRALGHECLDVIANHRDLQRQWSIERGFGQSASLGAMALQQIEDFKPDVLFMQDLSFFDAATLRFLGGKYLLAGQCSCPMPRAENVARFDVIFTSFPHYVDKFKALGVRGEYLPLAFEHTILDRIPPQERDIDVSFVGGLGADLHWKAGTHAFEALAEAIGERFQWYGYGVERLPKDSPLRKCYRGQAWGLDMYRIYGRSKCVVNRHGEVAEGHANNLRIFESSGMGAYLITDNKFRSPFLPVGQYEKPQHLIRQVHSILGGEDVARHARMMQGIVLKNHTYAHRMKRASEVLSECLVAA